MVVYGLWMLAYTASVLLPWDRVHAISGGNASVLCSSVVLTHIVLSVSASTVVVGCSVLLYCHMLCQEEEHGWYSRVWVQPSASCRYWNACKSRFCLPKYIASLLFTLYILIYWFINCLSVFRFTRNQRKRQTLYHLWHKENYQFQNQYPFLKTKVSVETQEKVVILEGPSTISAHKDANNWSTKFLIVVYWISFQFYSMLSIDLIAARKSQKINNRDKHSLYK
jgi:hypothetical protein